MSVHEQSRIGLRIVGFVLIIIGVPLAVTGAIALFELQANFFSLSFEEASALSARGFGFLVPGMFTIIGGIGILRFGYLGKVSKYVADEVGPAVSSVSKSVLTGVKEAGGVDINVHSNEKVMIKCRSCSTLNDENATYCDKCGAQL